MIDQARNGAAQQTEARRRYLEGQIRWARAGGIDAADQGQLWKARMRRYVASCEAELDNWVGLPPLTSVD